MSMTSNESPPETVTLTIDEVPEVSRYALPFLFGYIKMREKMNAGSFGAYIVRKAGRAAFEACAQQMHYNGQSAIRGTGKIYTPSRFHADSSLAGLSVTAHYSEGGPLVGVFLIGAEFGNNYARPGAQELYETSEYQQAAFSTQPTLALGVEIRDTDLVIFDHTQPHAFEENKGATRASEIIYRT